LATCGQCGGTVEGPADEIPSWSSSNSSIASLTAGLHSARATFKGVAPGLANGNVQATDEGCTATASGPLTVQPTIQSFDPNPIMIGSSNGILTIRGSGFGTSPTVNLPAAITYTGHAFSDSQIVLQGVNVAFSATIGSNSVTVTASSQKSAAASLLVNGPNQMVVQNDQIGQTTGDPHSQSRFVTYTVKNYDGSLASNIPIAESISFSGWNCQQTNPGNTWAHCTAIYSTDGGGGLTDEWSMYTGYTPAGCGENVTDHWQWCGPTGQNPNPGITFGSLIGWAHTSSVDINGYINPPTPIPQGTVFSP
jgi:hypothetical protein